MVQRATNGYQCEVMEMMKLCPCASYDPGGSPFPSCSPVETMIRIHRPRGYETKLWPIRRMVYITSRACRGRVLEQTCLLTSCACCILHSRKYIRWRMYIVAHGGVQSDPSSCPLKEPLSGYKVVCTVQYYVLLSTPDPVFHVEYPG